MTREPDQEGRQAPDKAGPIRPDGTAAPDQPEAGFPPPPPPAKAGPVFKTRLLPLALLWTGAVFGLSGAGLAGPAAAPLFWACGLALGGLLFYALARDAARREQAFKELQERAAQMELRVEKRSASLHLRQRQLQALIDNVRPGAYIKNIHHEFILVNVRLCALLGAPAEQLLGGTGQACIRPGLAGKIMELEQRVLNEKKPLEIDDLFEEADQPGGRSINLFIFPVIGPDGRLEGSGGLLKDVTEHHQRKQELSRARAEAQKAAQAKSSFLANISHEFRTPLNGIIGTADLLARGELSADQASMAAVIKQAGDALLAALNDVLDLSNIENGKMQLNARPFNLREVVFEALKGLAPIARSKALELMVDIDSQLPDELYGDDVRLRQILLNLVSNALKFTNGGEVRVSLSSQGEPGPPPEPGPDYGPEAGPFPNCRFRLSVSDTGIGIPENKRRVIFEAFEQVDGSSTRNYGGAGLGLAISHHLAALMNSRLNLISAEGRGSTFWLDLELPVIVSSAPAPPPNAADGAPDRRWEQFDAAALAAGLTAESALVSSRRLEILLAEDMVVNQIVARRMLEELGHQVTVAANGAEALNLFRDRAFDLILMDIQMPVMDGLTAAAKIRELEAEQQRPHTPVAAMTAHALQGDRERYLARGLDEYQSKPLSMSGLAKMIEEMIERWNIEGQPAAPPKPRPEAPAPEGGPEPGPAAQILDFETVKLSFGGNKALLRKSMELYLRDAPAVLGKINAALAEDQPGEAAGQAHALKGISGYYTKAGPYLLSMELDKRARQAQWPEERPGLNRLAAELGAAVEALTAEMRSYLSYED